MSGCVDWAGARLPCSGCGGWGDDRAKPAEDVRIKRGDVVKALSTLPGLPKALEKEAFTVVLLTILWVQGQWVLRAHPKNKRRILGRAVKTPPSHTRVLVQASQVQLLTPASCQCRQ